MTKFELQKVIDIALAEVGYLEKQSNSMLDDKTANAGKANYTKYAKELYEAGYYNGNKNGYAWCDVFVDWCFYKAFGKELGQELQCQTGPYGAGCAASAQYYKDKGRFFPDNPQIGDQIFLGSKAKPTHTGLVYDVRGGRVYTVEGNTSGASGVVANGGGVCKKSYPLNYNGIYGYGRPAYNDGYGSSTGGSSSSAPAKLTVDGKWGEATTTRLQQIFGTTVDGKISNQHLVYKVVNPGLTSGWDWDEKPNGRGSQLIKAMQKWAGMAPADCDGEWGPKTCKAIQRKVGTIQDGKVSKPSQMVKALQRWANNQ